jgi:DNA mismatch repair protein MutL
MPRIQKLAPGVVNKIAAGEVIERPASVVKELLENSVDAGAKRIDVSVEKGGCELIRVSDDGHGIAADQLLLAVESHATSKIREAEDLFQVGSLGFRGEALASIASVSQTVLRSRPHDCDAGAELEIAGGHLRGPNPCGCPSGTVIEVRNLFYNTPVRRKFLRTTQTEMGHVAEAFTRVALAHPEVHMTLRHNGRELYDLQPAERWLERITSFFAELREGLIWVESQDDQVRLSGYVADPSFSRGNNRMQYVILNGRHIRDRSLQHALGEAYRGLLLTGRFPMAFLRLELPPEAVDVNVHPAKLEVRFADGGRLYSQLLGTLRNKFLTTDLTARAHIQDAGSGQATEPEGQGTIYPPSPHVRQLPAGTTGAGPVRERRTQETLDLREHPPTGALPQFRPFGTDDHFAPNSTAATPHLAAPPAPIGRGLQVQNRYLVTEDDQGMVVIDQHALHERILYEQLRERVLAGTLETQRFLVPETVNLTAAEAALILETRETLASLGIEIEPFGGDTILVSSYPAMLGSFSPSEVIRQIADQMMGGGKTPDRRDLVDELLHMISCKAAIKAGDRLSSEEVTALLEQRHLFHDTHHCPHGRPTALVFTKEELDKRFKRT